MTKRNEPAPLVLCAEDHHELRDDLCDELREAGYRVIEASHGEEALAHLKAMPDIILCDITMPRLNGYALLERVRSDFPQLADTPFIFLTALSQRYDVIEGKRMGADDYLVKPIDYDLLLVTLEARLRQVNRMRTKSTEELDHLRQGIHHLRTDNSQKAFEAAKSALDMMAVGVVLLNDKSQPLLTNRAALRLNLGQAPFHQVPSLERLSNASSRQLHQAIREGIHANHQHKEHNRCLRLSRLGEYGMKPDMTEVSDLMIFISSLANGAGNADAPAVVVMLIDPAQRVQLPEPMLAELFGFTPTEASIAMRLADGQRKEDIADQMEVSPTTVAFHLRNLFQKTDTRRQAELIAMILAGSISLNIEA
ncbi:response regulator [Vreelandella aquamarina]|uniref:response regulator n=1 Tax=Vreelandella aquamarina TaxID=77097 RepID=UPI003850072B